MKYFHQISFSNFHLHLWKCNIRLCENNDCARNASFTFSSLAEFDYLNKEQPPWSLLLCLKLLWKTLLGSFQSSSNSLVWSLSFRFIITKILTKACNKAKMMENDLIEKYDFCSRRGNEVSGLDKPLITFKSNTRPTRVH